MPRKLDASVRALPSRRTFSTAWAPPVALSQHERAVAHGGAGQDEHLVEIGRQHEGNSDGLVSPSRVPGAPANVEGERQDDGEGSPRSTSPAARREEADGCQQGSRVIVA